MLFRLLAFSSRAKKRKEGPLALARVPCRDGRFQNGFSRFEPQESLVCVGTYSGGKLRSSGHIAASFFPFLAPPFSLFFLLDEYDTVGEERKGKEERLCHPPSGASQDITLEQ